MSVAPLEPLEQLTLVVEDDAKMLTEMTETIVRASDLARAGNPDIFLTFILSAVFANCPERRSLTLLQKEILFLRRKGDQKESET